MPHGTQIRLAKQPTLGRILVSRFLRKHRAGVSVSGEVASGSVFAREGDPHSVRMSRAIIPGYGLPEQDASASSDGRIVGLPREAGSTPARQQPVPLPLQPFVDRGFADRENVRACWEFIRGELREALGEPGGQIWATLFKSTFRLYPSKDAQAAAILERWLEAWGYIERAKREAA